MAVAQTYFIEFPESSTLTDAEYFAEHEKMIVTFRRHGGMYAYQNVPENIWAELAEAESPGTYFNKNILNKFPTNRIM